MPVAEHFSTEGVENGFPYCLEKYDMTDATDNPYSMSYEPWTLEQVMSFYWNFNSTTILAQDTAYDSDGVVTLDESQAERVCEPNPYLFDVNSTPSLVKVALLRDVVKLYSGDKTIEANFVGYAFGKPDLDSGPLYPDSVPYIFRRGQYDFLSNYRHPNGFFPVAPNASVETYTGNGSNGGGTFKFWQMIPPSASVNDMIDFTSSTALDFYTY